MRCIKRTYTMGLLSVLTCLSVGCTIQAPYNQIPSESMTSERNYKLKVNANDVLYEKNKQQIVLFYEDLNKAAVGGLHSEL